MIRGQKVFVKISVNLVIPVAIRNKNKRKVKIRFSRQYIGSMHNKYHRQLFVKIDTRYIVCTLNCSYFNFVYVTYGNFKTILTEILIDDIYAMKER